MASQQNTVPHSSNPYQKCVKLIKPDANMLRRLMNEEKDERYRYLLKHGNIVSIESESLSLYVELP